MEQTDIFGFNLMEGTDPVQAAPLNENMRRTEEALAPTVRSIPAYSAGELGRHNVYLKQAHILTLGPCTDDPDAYAGGYDPLYDELIMRCETGILGETAYACKGSVAYRLDNRTKTAEVLLDLSGYFTESRSAGSMARVICADAGYVYFMEGYFDPDTGTGSATFVKFDHQGNPVLTRTTTDLNELRWDQCSGFVESEPCFAFQTLDGEPYPCWQTANAFGVRPYTRVRSLENVRRSTVYLFSKETLAFIKKSDNVYIYHDELSDPAYVCSTLQSGYLLVRGESVGDGGVYTTVCLFDTQTGGQSESWLTLDGAACPFGKVLGHVGDYVLLGNLYAAAGGDPGFSCIRLSEIQAGLTCELPYRSGTELYITGQRELLQWYDWDGEAIRYRGADYPVDQANALNGEPALLNGDFEIPCFCLTDGEYWFRQGDSYYKASAVRRVYTIDRVAEETETLDVVWPGTGGTAGTGNTGNTGGTDDTGGGCTCAGGGAGGIHVIDIGSGTFDVSLVDFSPYSAGDIIMIVGDMSM